MSKFRDIETLQKFASVHASIHNRFNFNRHLNRRDVFKQNQFSALSEWRQLAACTPHAGTLCRLVQVCLTLPVLWLA